MADAASTLRTARAAVSEGLITEADYEVVKAAFLKAQQFKAGLDAGFISEADYAEVKTRFLDAFYGLHVSADGGGSGSVTPQRPASPALGQPNAMAGAMRTDSPPPAPQGGQTAAASPLQPQPPPQPMQASLPPSARGGSASGSGDGGRGDLPANRDLPANIPSMGGALRKKTGPQTSMSGIAVSDDAVNLFYYMKAKAAYRWAMWGINPAGTEIIIVDVGKKDSPYEDFVERLPENDCRFAVYDYQVKNSEGRIFDKLVFISWSPDNARIKNKMMYASTKDFFKSYLEGLAVELQVSDRDEITQTEIHDHVLSVLTRK